MKFFLEEISRSFFLLCLSLWSEEQGVKNFSKYVNKFISHEKKFRFSLRFMKTRKKGLIKVKRDTYIEIKWVFTSQLLSTTFILFSLIKPPGLI